MDDTTFLFLDFGSAILDIARWKSVDNFIDQNDDDLISLIAMKQ